MLHCSLAILLLAGLAPMAQADEPGTSTQVTVNWTDPEQFTELRYSHTFNRPKPEVWLNEFRQTLVRSGDRVLEPGQRLDVTITDIKLAGRQEPWRGPAYSDVRVVRSVYPPQIDLSFRLSDASGNVIEDGTRRLRDLAFLQRGTTHSSEPYRYEKRLLKDWMAREFGRNQS
jgi:hypothetical protein